jgi:hypothetical protein
LTHDITILLASVIIIGTLGMLSFKLGMLSFKLGMLWFKRMKAVGTCRIFEPTLLLMEWNLLINRILQ